MNPSPVRSRVFKVLVLASPFAFLISASVGLSCSKSPAPTPPPEEPVGVIAEALYTPPICTKFVGYNQSGPVVTVTASDSNACTSPTAPCATWSHVLSLAVPGDTICIQAGTYGGANSNYPIDCNPDGNARNGLPSQSITVAPYNPQCSTCGANPSHQSDPSYAQGAAIIEGWYATLPGIPIPQVSAMSIAGCQYWNVWGLRMDGIDHADTSEGALFHIAQSNNIQVRRVGVSKSNRCTNHHLLLVENSSDVLVEESVLYDFHRHGIITEQTMDQYNNQTTTIGDATSGTAISFGYSSGNTLSMTGTPPANGTIVTLAGASLPTGLATGVDYYVVGSTTSPSSSFELSDSLGGAPISLSCSTSCSGSATPLGGQTIAASGTSTLTVVSTAAFPGGAYYPIFLDGLTTLACEVTSATTFSCYGNGSSTSVPGGTIIRPLIVATTTTGSNSFGSPSTITVESVHQFPAGGTFTTNIGGTNVTCSVAKDAEYGSLDAGTDADAIVTPDALIAQELSCTGGSGSIAAGTSVTSGTRSAYPSFGNVVFRRNYVDENCYPLLFGTCTNNGGYPYSFSSSSSIPNVHVSTVTSASSGSITVASYDATYGAPWTVQIGSTTATCTGFSSGTYTGCGTGTIAPGTTIYELNGVTNTCGHTVGGPDYSTDAYGGPGLSFYPGYNSLMENNVTRDGSIGFSSEAGSHNRMLGNISINDYHGLRYKNKAGTENDLVVKDVLIFEPRGAGLQPGSGINAPGDPDSPSFSFGDLQLQNVSVIGANGTTPEGLDFGNSINPNLNPYPNESSYSISVSDVFMQNVGSTSVSQSSCGGTGASACAFDIDGDDWGSCDVSRLWIYNGGSTPSQYATTCDTDSPLSTNTTPNGTGCNVGVDATHTYCVAYTFCNAALAPSDRLHAPIGANIVYRLENGVAAEKRKLPTGGFTDNYLWDPTTNSFPCDADFWGALSPTPHKCSDISTALSIGSANCSHPSAY